MGHMSESEVIEARVRLVVGLKRYFHGKRVEGLLSTSVSFQAFPTSACLEGRIRRTGLHKAEWRSSSIYS